MEALRIARSQAKVLSKDNDLSKLQIVAFNDTKEGRALCAGIRARASSDVFANVRFTGRPMSAGGRSRTFAGLNNGRSASRRRESRGGVCVCQLFAIHQALSSPATRAPQRPLCGRA